MASFECLFRTYSRKECGLSGRYKDQKALAPLKTREKDISGHLNGCYKTTSEGVDICGMETLPTKSWIICRRGRFFYYLPPPQR